MSFTEPKSAECHDGDVQRLFYEPIVLEKALGDVNKKIRGGSSQSGSVPADSLITDEQWFHCFENKLAQVCDNERGGNTVTSVAIVRCSGCPLFVLGSNQRKKPQRLEMENFVTGLLNLIGKNPDQLQLKALRRKVLWRILEFGIKRVDLYLKYLGLSLDQCIDDCQTQDGK